MNPTHVRIDARVYPRPFPAPDRAATLHLRTILFGWFLLDMIVLVCASALFGAAIHSFNHYRDGVVNGDPYLLSPDKMDEVRTVLYSIAGLLPLVLGVTGEVKRLTFLEMVQAQKPKQIAERL